MEWEAPFPHSHTVEVSVDIEIAVAKSKKEKPKEVRLQSGCIPYRDVDGVRQVLLVKKLKKGAWWGFTKGGQ
jgi:hypothetical protein